MSGVKSAYLSGIDWDCGDLDPHPETHEQATYQQANPALRERLREHGEDDEEVRGENGATTAQEVVDLRSFRTNTQIDEL